VAYHAVRENLMAPNAAFWDNLAEKYSKQPVANPEAFERKIELTKARMTPQSVVLDIGCGTGSLVLRLAPNGRHVHGLDVSSEMIRIARGKAQSQGIENVSFHVGPFDETFATFEPGSLEGICAYSLLHLVDDRSAVLSKILGLLRPGGFFVSSTVCLRESWVPYAPIIRVMRALGKAPMVKSVDKRTLAAEITGAGFVDLVAPEVGAKSSVAFFLANKP